jgi:hypothetical protein
MLKITFWTRALQATLADVEKREELLGLLAVLTSDAVITNITLRATRAISRWKFGLLPNEMREMLSGHTAHLPLWNAKIDEDANARILELLRSSKVKTKNTVEVPKKWAQFESWIDANTEMNPYSQLLSSWVLAFLGHVNKRQEREVREDINFVRHL